MANDQEGRIPSIARIFVTGLTDDQVAIMVALGSVPISGAERQVEVYYERPALLRTDDPTLDAVIIRRHCCPVIEYRGRMRIVLPNGDLREADAPAPMLL